jgi:hypothetical protein
MISSIILIIMLLVGCIYLLSLRPDNREKFTCTKCDGSGYDIAHSSIIAIEWCGECNGRGYIYRKT